MTSEKPTGTKPIWSADETDYFRVADDSGVERRFVPAPELPDTLPQWDRLPGVETRVVNGNFPRRQFIQQLRYRRRYFTGSRYDHCPIPGLLGTLSC
jgi:hypothetical protein